MIRKWIILCFALFPSTLFAQLELDFRTGPVHDVRMLIVPFDPIIYYNDATPEMAQKYNMTHDQLMTYFRREWNKQIHMAFADSCYTVDLYSDNTKEARDDLDGLYTIISYEMRNKMQNAPEEEKELSLFRKIFPKKEKQQSDENFYGTKKQNGELVNYTQGTENKFFHIVFNDTTFLRTLVERRDIDYFLFINQFEIKGNYSDPYASGRSDFTRTLKVHFSIFDRTGTLVHGSYASVDIPFYLYDKDIVVGEYFPPAIRQIIHNVKFSY